MYNQNPIITIQHRIRDGFDTISADLQSSADGYQEYYFGDDGSIARGEASSSGGANSGGGGKFNPDSLQTGLDTALQLVSVIANRQRNETKQQVKAVCGRKPLFGGVRKDAYRKCAMNVNNPKPETARYNVDEQLPMGIWVVIGLGSAVVISLGIFGISKLMKDKQITNT